jgi:pimeloyl-ACP methyl ester carboxylesterase
VDTQQIDALATGFLDSQEAVLDRYGLTVRRHHVDVATTGGQAQVLSTGDGPPLVLVIGGALPAAFWAPLMARIHGHTLHAIELPGFGLTDPTTYRASTLRRTAVDHLSGVLDALGIGASQFVTQSMGSQWTTWLAESRPERVLSQVIVGCPAFFLDTSAALPFRLASIPGLGRVLMSLQSPSGTNVERLLRMVGEDPAGLDEIRDLLVATQRLPTYASSLVALMRACMYWSRPRRSSVTTEDDLREINHPVRLVWGREDTFGSLESGRRIARLIPGAEIFVVPGGHAPWLHNAELVAALASVPEARTGLLPDARDNEGERS